MVIVSRLQCSMTIKQTRSLDKATRRRIRLRADGPSKIKQPDSFMDEIELMNTTDGRGVIFGAYGVDDWASSSHIKTAIDSGRSTLTLQGTWITEAGFELHAWILGYLLDGDHFNFMSKNRALVFMSWGMIEASVSRGKLEVEANGGPADVMAFIEALDAQLKRAENLIEWVYNSRGDSISVPLNYRPAIKSAYPWLPKDIHTYIDDYLNSAASVIILIGPPGTGKTTFIKNLIHRSGADAKVTYDEKVMSDDSLFAGFIEGDTRFLIMEDADAFLATREDGNTMMHRFLNVSDGLISAEGKKLVFSTNLPSVHDIDSALMRPGRCFDVVEFRPLTRVEALDVAEEIKLDHGLPDGSEFTLAEIFNTQPSGEARTLGRKIGF